MNASLPRSPRFLLTITAVLTIAGVALLALPHGMPTHTTASTPRPEAAASSLLPVPPPHAPEATHKNAEAAGATAQSAAASELPPHGEGAAGDAAIQNALDASWPSDLPDGDERQLLTAGRDVLRADATGIGRAKWPGVFPGSDQGVAPAFGTARFRIQAAIARRDGADDRAVVHLVWAGADRGGTFADARITDWYFTRTPSRKGASTWTPQPRT